MCLPEGAGIALPMGRPGVSEARVGEELAHDCAQILAAVRAMIGLARSEKDDGPRDALLEEAGESCETLGRLIGRMGGKVAVPHLKTERGVSAEQATARAIRRTVSGTGVRASLQVDGGNLRVAADDLSLQQILGNLLVNASEAMGGGGEVEVTVGRAEGGMIEWRIRDHGPGISARDAARLFDARFSTKPGGAGLGLAICLRLAGENRGSIDLVHVSGGGACFRLRLPSAHDEPAAPAFSPMDLSVLVADDHELVRELAGRQLEKAGCRVVTMGSAIEVVAHVRSVLRSDAAPDVVILDRQFANGERGEDAALELRALAPRVYLVACSGYESALAFAPPAEPFFDALLPKPFSPEELSRVLADASASRARATLR